MGGGVAAPEAPPRKLTRGYRVIRFIEEHCVHPDGEWIGQPFRLEPWERALVLALFELGLDGLRRYRWALIGLPKKNGKTTLAAAIALYLLLADGEPSPLVVCAAASDDQADLVYGAAKKMCELSPTLAALTERFDKEILVPSIPGARLRRVAAAAGTNDGQNISAVICDELHEWLGEKGERVWNVLTNSVGARRQPLVLQITTAGYDLDSICGKQYQYGRRVESGEVVDARYYFHWRQAPDDCDYRDPAMWRIANPNYGVSVRPDFFADQLTKKTESIFRRYFLNQWVSSERLWLPFGAWAACYAPELELDPARPLRVGVDLAWRNDSTAVVAAQQQEDRVVVRARIWENPYAEEDARHQEWALNIFEVEEYLRELRAAFPEPATEVDGAVLPGPEFCYDPSYFGRSAQVLEGDGLAMVEYPQHDSRMIPASQSLYQAIVEGRLAHDGDPALGRQVANVTADQRPRGWRISKPKGSRKKIDAAVALAIAAHRALEPSPAARESAYADHDVVVV